MTLIASLTGLPFSIMATDRLTTLQSARDGRYLRDHNPRANKLVVVVSEDAVFSIGFCGLAYVSGVPTDDWIASTVSPGANFSGPTGQVGTFGFKRPNKLRFHQICNRLRLGLAHNNVGTNIQLLITGWRVHRKRVLPISIVLQAASVLGPDLNMKMRSPTNRASFTFGHIGANVTAADLYQATANQNNAVLTGVAIIQNHLTNLIRNKAATDRTVGSHVMSVILTHPNIEHRIICRFDPSSSHLAAGQVQDRSASLPVAYSPGF